jgi:hypothetical protein
MSPAIRENIRGSQDGFVSGDALGAQAVIRSPANPVGRHPLRSAGHGRNSRAIDYAPSSGKFKVRTLRELRGKCGTKKTEKKQIPRRPKGGLLRDDRLYSLLDAVRQSEADIRHVRGIHFDLVEQVAHAARFFGAEQMALSGAPAHDLPGGSDLKALGGAAMRLQLSFLVLLHDFLGE